MRLTHESIIFYLTFILLSVLGFNHFINASTADGKSPSHNITESLLQKHIFGLFPTSHCLTDKYDEYNRTIYGDVAIIGVNGENKLLKPLLTSRAALGCGADTTYIFSTKQAIKDMCAVRIGYAEMALFPYIDWPNGPHLINKFLLEMNSVVFARGVSANKDNLTALHFMINQLKINDSLLPPLIFDSDSIKVICHYKDLLRDYKGDVYITPNVKEVEWLKDAFPCNGHKHKTGDVLADIEHLKHIAKNISPNATIIVKGPVDKIITPNHVITCDVPGNNKRISGQGDLLAGSLAQFAHMSLIFRHNYTCPVGPNSESMRDFPKMLAAYAACSFTRKASKTGFEQYGKDMMVNDLKDHFEAVLNKTRDQH